MMNSPTNVGLMMAMSNDPGTRTAGLVMAMDDNPNKANIGLMMAMSNDPGTRTAGLIMALDDNNNKATAGLMRGMGAGISNNPNHFFFTGNSLSLQARLDTMND
jgi:hypothetical protein